MTDLLDVAATVNLASSLYAKRRAGVAFAAADVNAHCGGQGNSTNGRKIFAQSA
ncbi:hypothetical protein VA602_17950 [Pseudomonas sp. MH2]|uniref:Uncharacterized protein n=1 Tax=Pseudomonas machongensis TaxID=3110229 RepID=A0ABU5VMH1_9PSED|nr:MULTISPECIES: hypothetical protein [Pseudomonas]MEA5673215.1 hypothetical protein [Pseudomonas sp. MH2]